MFRGKKTISALLALGIFLICAGRAAAAGSIPSFLSFSEGRGRLLEKVENEETATQTYQVSRNDAALWQEAIESAGFERNGLWLFSMDDGDTLLVASYRDRATEDPVSFLMDVMGEHVRCHLLVQTVFKPDGDIRLVVTHSQGINFHEKTAVPMPAPKMVQKAENVERTVRCSMSLWHSSLPGGAKDCSVCHGTGIETHNDVVYTWVEAEGHWEQQDSTETHDCWVCHGTGSYGLLLPCPLCQETGHYTVTTYSWVWKSDMKIF